ncbi:MAG: trypsin-like peptidase domain-containing protein [Bacteroidales bacterium]|nr:trypsin-like peptidase domain-containing protein [Bacteroidales bacterium]
MTERVIIATIILLLSSALYSQKEFPAGEPLFPVVKSWHDVPVDPSVVETMRAIDQPKDQAYQFAIPVEVSLTPENSGMIVTNDNETIWVLPLVSKGALSLNLILSPYDLPEGAYIFIYDPERREVRGAYTWESGVNTGVMPLLPVPGERIVLECHFPGKSLPRGKIGVKQVAHDFAGFFRLAGEKDAYYGRAGECEVDINCSTNENYLRAARSTVRLLVAGAELCTGVLVNNTGTDYKAYVLTAQHCIDNASKAANTIFVFNYCSPWCDGPDLTNMHSISGSLLRASNPDVDFALVELSSFPSLVFRPYFAGWDITSPAPANTYCLHHPEGDVMKISIDSNSPVSSDYPVSGYAANSFWRILKWDMGTTESGSSGSPLFDPNGRLRGTLTGGSATCNIPENDYYAKLLRMFNITTISSTHLKPWLDPVSSGSTVTNGRDPYAWNLSQSDTLQNIPRTDPGQTDSYTGPGFGYSTGHNSDSLVRYAEYIPFAGIGEIAWVIFRIATTSYLTTGDSIRIYVWAGGAQPGAVIASRKIKLTEVKNNFELEVDFGRTVAVTGPYYVGYTIFYKNSISSPQPQFSVKHSAPYSLPTQNTAWLHDGVSWKPFTQHPSFPMAVSLAVNVIMVENSILNDIAEINPVNSALEVFPNPFTNSLSFRITDSGASSTSLTLFDNSGRVVSSTQYRNIFPGVLTLDLPSLAPGVYHYNLLNDTIMNTGSVIKIDSRQ